MALRRTRYALLVLLALFLLVTPSAIYSCGPFLETAVFAFRDQPDGPAENFAAGTLGIVRPSFRISYLVIAYRYLIGLKLTPAQQKAAIDVWNRDAVPEHPGEEESVASWIKARSEVPDLPPAQNISALAPVSPEQPYFQYVNCPSDAFQTAIKTLGERATKFGLKTGAMKDWVSAQDAVFANCSGGAHVLPAELPAGDPLLRADRAYQIASANLYARSFDDAVRDFDAIAKDPSSPWAPISPYLAARVLIRKATLGAKENQPFDPAPMAEAQHRLEQIVNDPKFGAIHAPALKLLNYVRFRTEPAKRVAELEQVMLRPDPGPSFKQDLWDYVLLLSHGEQAGDLSDWVKTYAALAENVSNGDQLEDLAKHSQAAWRGTKAVPWLIATLKATNPASPELSSLLSDARGVAGSSAGYLTVQYSALALMCAAGEKEAARKELDRLLSHIKSETPADTATPVGSYNLLNDLRLTLTTSLEDFLQHAAEHVVGADEGPGTDDQIDNPAGGKKDQEYLPPYSAKVFQKRLPLALLTESTQSSSLSKSLRRNLARTTWVRAILLNDMSTATKLQTEIQELDLPLWKSMEPFRAASNDAAKHFAGIFIILENPGLKPSAQAGLPRSATLGEIENYRDNWWCASMYGGANWADNPGIYADPSMKAADLDAGFPFPTWLTESQKKAAQEEWSKLTALGTAPNYLAQQVLARAQQDANDPLLPQALYLTVRATRFGCSDTETSALSKAAFEFLHKHYPESEWAAKTKYYY
jgi:hypothetical protein